MSTLVDAQGEPRYSNRLLDEDSPYLRQHGHNPVNWFPWGDAAFEQARERQLPVFLSVGYSTCHWCHVMEQESFDNEAIAACLNQHFVSIKLDREQRPDLDEVYMTALQLLTGQGGWPMSCFLTAAGEPFFAGTYYAPDAFLALLNQISDAWQQRRADVLGQARQVSDSVRRASQAKLQAQDLAPDLLRRAVAMLLTKLDAVHGGFGGAPKFPNESLLLLGLDACRRGIGDATGKTLEDGLQLTLEQMALGGIYDQVGGGFHRYAVDGAWQIPHFEKMLYNQALLLRAYARLHVRQPGPTSRRVVQQTVDYLLRDLSSPDGLFYSAVDADSEGEEGRFYVWTPTLVDAALAPEDAALFKTLYQLDAPANFNGAWLPCLREPPEGHAAESAEAFTSRLMAMLLALNAKRDERVKPLRDEKVITAWNGMMITALLEADPLLPQGRYLDIARRTAESLWAAAMGPAGLWRIRFEGHTSIQAQLEDYACFAEACLNLHRVTAEAVWLARGQQLVDEMLARFWDDADGGFFASSAANSGTDTGPVFLRPKPMTDTAIPAANSVALAALLLLHEATGNPQLLHRINACVSLYAAAANDNPLATSYFILQFERLRQGPVDDQRWLADGHIHASLTPTDRGACLVLSIEPGWQLGGAAVNDDHDVVLMPTQLTSSEPLQVDYPPGETYTGKVKLLLQGQHAGQQVVLSYQACSEQLCLARCSASFFLPERSGQHPFRAGP